MKLKKLHNSYDQTGSKKKTAGPSISHTIPVEGGFENIRARDYFED